MKKIFLFLSFLCILSCSSDGGDSPNSNSGNLSFNDNDYAFDKIYVVKQEAGYSVYITNGELTFDFTNPTTPQITYSGNFTRFLGFTITTSATSLDSGTFGFPVIPVGEPITDDIILFRNDYQIENGNASSYNTIFNYTDNTSNQSRVVITKFDNGKYSFDFNVITTAGVLTGTYTGTIIKTNY